MVKVVYLECTNRPKTSWRGDLLRREAAEYGRNAAPTWFNF